MKIKRILFIFLLLVLVASIFAQNSYWKCGTIEELMEQRRRARMFLSPGYGPSYIYSKHFLVHFDTTGPNITSFAYAESVSMYAESLWGKSDEKLPWGSFNPEAAGPDDRYDIFIRNLSSYDKIFSGESLGAREYLSYIECDNNTFKTQTVIRFPLPTVNKVSILIYDQSGAVVKNFNYGKQKFGTYTLRWDGRDNKGKMVDPGIYFYTLKISSSETSKSIIFFLGNKMEAMKGEMWEKTIANESTEKTGKIQEAAPDYPKRILEMLEKRSKDISEEIKKSRGVESTGTASVHLYPLDYQKIMLTGDSPKKAFWRAESIYKEAKEIFKKASIKEGIYQPKGSFYLFTSATDGYLATLLSIDGYLLSKGLLPESLPTSVLDVYKYEAVLMKIPGKRKTLVSYFWVVYYDLFRQRPQDKWEVKKTDEAFDKVKFIVKTLKDEAKKEKGWR